MRYVMVAVSGVLLGAAVFSSCTCHQQVGQPPDSFQEPPSGFHASGQKITPQMRVEVPTATPAARVAATQPELARAAATPTPPAEVPADFPKDVPIYKDAALARVQDLANNAHNVIFTTAAPVAEVFSFYQGKMTGAGWKIAEQFSRSGHAYMKFEKGSMVANLTVAEDVQNPGKQIIAIMYEEVQPLPFDDF
ncbi:MAG TPA: hypothetical protein VF515_08020 [Candidatus Binatia bacterium]|jgi:hypothetical protein